MAADRPHLLSLRIAAWRLRRALVVAGVVVLALAVARQAAPPAPSTDPVVVAARDLQAGTTLAAGDLREVRLPVGHSPDGTAATAEDLVGRRVVVDVPARLVVVEQHLDGHRFAVDPPGGTVLVPLRLADPGMAALLRPGDRVDVVAPGPDGPARVLARAALVVEVPAQAEEMPLGLGTGPPGPTPVVVAVDPEAGRDLAVAAGTGEVSAVLVQ